MNGVEIGRSGVWLLTTNSGKSVERLADTFLGAFFASATPVADLIRDVDVPLGGPPWGRAGHARFRVLGSWGHPPTVAELDRVMPAPVLRPLVPLSPERYPAIYPAGKLGAKTRWIAVAWVQDGAPVETSAWPSYSPGPLGGSYDPHGIITLADWYPLSRKLNFGQAQPSAAEAAAGSAREAAREAASGAKRAAEYGAELAATPAVTAVSALDRALGAGTFRLAAGALALGAVLGGAWYLSRRR